MKKPINISFIVSSALILVATFLLFMVVIPSVVADSSPHAWQEKAVPALRVLAITHLLIVIFLVSMIVIDHRGGHINMGLLFMTGVLFILFSFVLMAGIISYVDHPGLHTAVTTMLVGTGFDFVAGLVALNEWRVKMKAPKELTHS